MNLLDVDDLSATDIYRIWENVSTGEVQNVSGDIAWSFEGNGIRTRTTFIQAFQRLKLNYVELPNFLKTGESIEDLAGYMDPFYSMYVIRDRDHERMADFAQASKRPVINAMSNQAHPCEVLTDAYFLNAQFGPITELRILLWGPVTNVFRSWHSLSTVLSLNLTHFCPSDFQHKHAHVKSVDELSGSFDVVITDGWPTNFNDAKYTLTEEHLAHLGEPKLLPTPPVTVGNEIAFSPSTRSLFVGYEQKSLLLPIQKSLVSYLLNIKEN